MKAVSQIDLHDYDSPIRRADGQVPYNGYLWPTESWWPSDMPQFRNRIFGRWNFGIVALNDGTFSVEGMTWFIKYNSDHPMPRNGEKPGRQVVFLTRAKAIRIAAARMIQELRAARNWGKEVISFERLDRDTIEEVINWTRAIVAHECGKPEPTPIVLPKPPPPSTGLELIDYINQRDHADEIKKKAKQ